MGRSPLTLTLSPTSGEDRNLSAFPFTWPVSLKYTPTSGEDTNREVILRPFLIDRDDRKTVLKEQQEPFLWPEFEWEKKGMTGSTTVANGLVRFKGQWLLYYGAADTVIGLATCPIAK